VRTYIDTNMRELPKTNASHDMVSGVKVCFSCALCDTWEMKEIDCSHHVACKCFTTKYVTAAYNILIVTFIMWPDYARPQTSKRI